jgi:hypothetical protein
MKSSVMTPVIRRPDSLREGLDDLVSEERAQMKKPRP